MARSKGAVIQALEQRLERNPASLAFARLADGYRKRGDLDEAIRICKNGIARHAGYTTGRIILGRCYMEQEKFKDAAEEFARVCTIDRRNIVAIKMAADIFARQGLEEKAGDLYNYLRLLDPDNESIGRYAVQFHGSGKNDIFSILGMAPQPASAGEVMEATREVRRPGDHAPTEEIPAPGTMELLPAGEEAVMELTAEPAQEDAAASESLQPLAEAAPAAAGVTGEDVSDRLDTMFEDALQEPAREQEPPVVSPEEAAELAASLPARDEPFSLDEIQNAQTMAVSGDALRAAAQSADVEELAPAGDEVAERIGALGGEEPAAPAVDDDEEAKLGTDVIENAPTMPISRSAVAEAIQEMPGADDIASRMDQLFQGESDAAAGDENVKPPQPVQATLEEIDLELAATPTVEMSQSDLLTLGEAEVSGDDVTSRIEELFGGDGADGDALQAPAEAAEPGVSDFSFDAGPGPRAVEEAPPAVDREAGKPLQVDEDRAKAIAGAQTVRLDRKGLGIGDTPAPIEETLDVAQVIDDAAVSGDDVSSRISEIFGEEEGEVPAAAAQDDGGTAHFDLATEETFAVSRGEDLLEPMESGLSAPEGLDDTSLFAADEPAQEEGLSIAKGVEPVAGGDVYVLSDATPSGDEVAAQLDNVFGEDEEVAADGEDGDVSIVNEQTATQAGEPAPVQDDTLLHDIGTEDTIAHDVVMDAEDTIQRDRTPDAASADEAASPDGSDVAERIDQIFGAEDPLLSSEAARIPEDDGGEQVGDGFYTLSGEDAKHGGSQEDLLGSVDQVELETPMPEMEDAAPALEDAATVAHEPPAAALEVEETAAVDLSEATEETIAMPASPLRRDRLHEDTIALDGGSSGDEAPSHTYSIPDHVLTPTLADIYYQQGQTQLAIQIYERILQRDGENERISQRLDEIRSAQAQGLVPQPPAVVPRSPAVADAAPASDPAQAADRQRKARRAASAKPKPLEGVRINRRVRDRLKKTRKSP